MDNRYKEMCALVKRNGYQWSRQNGSHVIYTKRGKPPIALTIHMNAMVAKRIIKENKLV